MRTIKQLEDHIRALDYKSSIGLSTKEDRATLGRLLDELDKMRQQLQVSQSRQSQP